MPARLNPIGVLPHKRKRWAATDELTATTVGDGLAVNFETAFTRHNGTDPGQPVSLVAMDLQALYVANTHATAVLQLRVDGLVLRTIPAGGDTILFNFDTAQTVTLYGSSTTARLVAYLPQAAA